MTNKSRETSLEVIRSLYWPVLLVAGIIAILVGFGVPLIMEFTWNCDDIKGSWNSVCLERLQMDKESNYNAIKTSVPTLIIVSLVISYQFRNKQQMGNKN